MPTLAEILARHPKLFAKNTPPRTPFDYFGIECGEGWAGLIDETASIIEAIADRDGQPLPTVLQIKEKFGKLQFYIGGATGAMFDAALAAEPKSAKICEVCGDPGRLHTDRPWIRTLCNRHAES